MILDVLEREVMHNVFMLWIPLSYPETYIKQFFVTAQDRHLQVNYNSSPRGKICTDRMVL